MPPPVPEGLDHERHVALAGRGAHPAIRRTVLTALGVWAILALANIFGQHADTSHASARFAHHSKCSRRRGCGAG